jgi:hypothetical protein
VHLGCRDRGDVLLAPIDRSEEHTGVVTTAVVCFSWRFRAPPIAPHPVARDLLLWCTGGVVPAVVPQRYAFCVCLIGADQLSVDDRRCRLSPAC